MEEVLGDEFEGVLVSDFYGAYNVYQGPHQRCWTHLLRDIHQLNEQYPQDPDLARWSQQVREVYDRAQAYPGPDPGLPETVRRSRRVKQQQQYQQQLWAICKPYLGSDAPMRVLCQRVERFLPELFTFVAEPQASADNNAAERSLRPPVVSRKISGGTRSEQGTRPRASWLPCSAPGACKNATPTPLYSPSSPNPYLSQSEHLRPAAPLDFVSPAGQTASSALKSGL